MSYCGKCKNSIVLLFRFFGFLQEGADFRMRGVFILVGWIGRRCGLRGWEMGNGLMSVGRRSINMMSEQ